jgi:hypothetical protein
MNTHTPSPSRNDLIVAVLGLSAITLILAVLSEFNLFFIADIRHATIALGLLGLAMCAVGGIVPTVKKNGWTSPAASFGIVLGVMALLIMGHACCGFWLPLIDSDRTAFLALAILIGGKVMVLDIPWDKLAD